MNLNAFMGDEELNEHEAAWLAKDWDAISKLADGFKESAENTAFALMDDITARKTEQDVGNIEYPMWYINNALSQHVETIYHAYIANLLHGMSDQMHYNYLLHSVRQGKLYGKWAKFDEDAEEKLYKTLIMKWYNIGMHDTEMYLNIMKKRGQLSEFLRKAKVLATPALIKTITKTSKEQTRLNKLVKSF